MGSETGRCEVMSTQTGLTSMQFSERKSLLSDRAAYKMFVFTGEFSTTAISVLLLPARLLDICVHVGAESLILLLLHMFL